MATASNAPYKKQQRKFEHLVKTRGKVLWRSCALVQIPDPTFVPEENVGMDYPMVIVKRAIQGTRIGKFTPKECY